MPAHAGAHVARKTPYSALVWYFPDDMPHTRRIWEDGLRWFVRDSKDESLMRIDDASGWVLLPQGTPGAS